MGNDLNGRPTSSGEKELITSLCPGGVFIGAIIAGLTTNKSGRKIAIYVGCVLVTVGDVLQEASYPIAQMIVGRLVVDFDVSSTAMVVPHYVAAPLPPKVCSCSLLIAHCHLNPRCNPRSLGWSQQREYPWWSSDLLRHWRRIRSRS